VRGRLGLRVGTSYDVWTGVTMEPFVIGSVWGNLSGDNQATLTSTGTTFQFTDDPDDAWAVISAGVNFFNPSAQTSVFAKLDVTLGEDTDGIGGKAGMRSAGNRSPPGHCQPSKSVVPDGAGLDLQLDKDRHVI
jgi:autotransporter family porin